MQRNTVVFLVSSTITAGCVIAARILGRREERMHQERMTILERETQNVREWREDVAQPLIERLDQQIANAKFWLIVTEES